MTKNKLLLLAVLLVLLPSSVAKSQTAVSDEKQKLIKQLILTTGADQNVRMIFDTLIRAYIAMMPPIEESSFKVAESAPPAFRKELIALANQTMKTIADRTRQRVIEDASIGKLQLEIVSNIWNETFTEDELRQLLQFFETPAGQKLTKAGPAIAAETSRRSLEVVGPLIGKVFDEVEREEFQKLYEPVRQLEKKYNIGKKSQ
jgi:hypothetical protein